MWKFALLQAFLLASLLVPATQALAASGTMMVAEKGQPAHIPASWPAGCGEVVNDPARTVGLNPWFTEWPNDLSHYGFEIDSAADLNRLVKKLSQIKTELKQIRLCPMKEPRGLGWVTSLPEGNNTAVVFTLGDQQRIDEWYKAVRKPFGKMEFLAAPVAVPPTLTIFVQNEAIDIEKLEIPEGIIVEGGCTPGVFHRSNTKQERDEAAKPMAVPAKQDAKELDAGTKAAAERIEAFLKRHPEDQ